MKLDRRPASWRRKDPGHRKTGGHEHHRGNGDGKDVGAQRRTLQGRSHARAGGVECTQRSRVDALRPEGVRPRHPPEATSIDEQDQRPGQRQRAERERDREPVPERERHGRCRSRHRGHSKRDRRVGQTGKTTEDQTREAKRQRTEPERDRRITVHRRRRRRTYERLDAGNESCGAETRARGNGDGDEDEGRQAGPFRHSEDVV